MGQNKGGDNMSVQWIHVIVNNPCYPSNHRTEESSRGGGGGGGGGKHAIAAGGGGQGSALSSPWAQRARGLGNSPRG